MRVNVDEERENPRDGQRFSLSLSLSLRRGKGGAVVERNDNGRPWLSDGKMASHDSDVTGGEGGKRMEDENDGRGGVASGTSLPGNSKFFPKSIFGSSLSPS